jgi:hypothetical protein
MVDDKLLIGKVEERQKCVYLKSEYKSKKTIKFIFFWLLLNTIEILLLSFLFLIHLWW